MNGKENRTVIWPDTQNPAKHFRDYITRFAYNKHFFLYVSTKSSNYLNCLKIIIFAFDDFQTNVHTNKTKTKYEVQLY